MPGLCRDVHRIRKTIISGCNHLRQDRLPVQLRPVLESIWTKVLQANGDMKTPMVAQIVGAADEYYFRPLADFWYVWTAPNGHCRSCCCHRCRDEIVAALIVYEEGLSPLHLQSGLSPIHCKRIFHLGMPNILIQSAYTFYILGLDLILAGFSDQAVTALGLYYKWQTFSLFPLNAMQTCIITDHQL